MMNLVAKRDINEKVLKYFLAISIIFTSIFTVLDYFIFGKYVGYVVGMFTILLVIIYVLLTKKIITAPTGAYLAASTTIFFAIPFSVFFSGGLYSSIICWYMVAPIGSLLLFGNSSKTYFFVAFSLISTLVFAIMEFYGYKFPVVNTQYLGLGVLFDFCGLILIVFLFTRIFENEKNEAYKSLESEKEIFKKYTQQMPGIIFQLQYFKDGTHKYIYLSKGAKSMFDIADDTILNSTDSFLTKLDKTEAGLLKKEFEICTRGLKDLKHTLKFKYADNDIKWITISAKPELQADKSIIWFGHAFDITEEKNAQDSLLESQRNVALITDTINDVFYLYDIQNKKYLFISPNCKNVMGVNDSFFYAGSKFTNEFVHEDDQQLLNEVNTAIDKGDPYNIDYRILVNDEVRWINEKSNPIKDENGVYTKNSGIVSDITKRKLAEEKFLESQNNILQITNTISDIFYLYDCIGKKYLFVSPSCINVLGVSDTFFYEGNSYTGNYAHPDDKKILKDGYDNIGEKGEYELTYRSIINGEQKWLNEKSFAIKNSKGEIIKISGIITDVTANKKIELQLLKSQKSLEEAQELAIIGSWEIDFFTTEIKWSKELYRIFELENIPSEQLLEKFKSKVHPEDMLEIENKIKLLVDNGKTDTINFRIIKNDGEIKYISAIAETIKSTNTKKVIGLKGATQDVTKQKLAELAKSNFLSTMSHEIRTPINGVIGLTNLLMDEKLTTIQREYVDTLNFSAQHLFTIVSDILDFSKIESGNLTFEKATFDLEQVCKNIFNLFKSKSEEKNIGFNFNPLAKNVSLVGDYVRLSQVLSNLIVNAIKFTRVGNVNFTYNIIAETTKNVTLKFEVSDTGIGISQNQQKRIFESFLQGDDTVTRQYGGTGLGLTISKKLVELQAGKIYVDSIHGKGSTFTVEITFEKNLLKKTELSFSDLDSLELKSLKNMKILVAEDNKINAMLLTKFLTKWDIESKVAENGQVAIDLLENEEFDLVLMDLQMPKMDGRRATKLIRQSEKSYINAIPIIAVTADALIESQRELVQNGFNDCITKPFNPNALFKILESYYKVLV